MRQFVRFIAILLVPSLLSACGGRQLPAHLSEEASVRRIAVIQGGVHGLTADVRGDIFYSDSFARGGRSVFRLKNPGTSPVRTRISGDLPAGLEAIGSDLWMCDTGAGTVSRYDNDLRNVAQFSATQPWNLTVDSEDNLIAVSYGGAVEKLRAAGRPQLLFSGLDAPFDIAADEDGNLWVSEQGAEGEGWVTLRRLNGSEITRVGPFDNPEGLVLASDGTLWIADTGTGKIYKYDRASGKLSLHTDEIELPIVGTETAGGAVVFNGRVNGEYGLFAM